VPESVLFLGVKFFSRLVCIHFGPAMNDRGSNLINFGHH